MFRITTWLLLLLLMGPSLYAQNDYFVPNRGQWEAPFLYKVEHSSATLYIESSGWTAVVGASENQDKISAVKEEIMNAPPVLDFHAYQIRWKNPHPNPTWIEQNPSQTYHNYFLGNNQKQWKSNVPLFQTVVQKNLYEGVDIAYYFTEQHFKYDLIVHPKASIQPIAFEIIGADEVSIKEGKLVIQTSVGEVVEQTPYVYQHVRGEKIEVPASFVIHENNQVEFFFPKGYNKSYPLIIDPEVVFATMTGSTADNWGFSATYDEQGHLYAGGIANGIGYPTTLGAFQLTYGGGVAGSMPCDMTISKFSPNGSQLIYSTYIGGAGDEMPHSLIVDHTGALILAGKTNSTDYPVTSAALQTTKAYGYDIVISKLSPQGDVMLGSTYLGGDGHDGMNVSDGYYGDQTTIKYNYGDGFRSEVVVDLQNNIYLAGATQSSNFPVSNNALKSSLGGLQDGVFVKMNPTLSQLIYGTYIGGTNIDAAYVIALNQSQTEVYVAGGTMSSDFHTSLMNGLHTQYQGGISDGFVLNFQNSGNYSVLNGTFIGTSGYDQVYGIEVDLEDQVYMMGQTTGSFPVTAGVYSNPGSTQFVMKTSPNLDQLGFSTVFGSGPALQPNISPVAFLVDTCKNIYISGWAAPQISPGTTTANMPITANAFQSTTDNADFYFIVLSQDANDILLGSYFGAVGKMEHVDGGTSRFDRKGVVYQSMCASCGAGNNFPATPNAYASVKGHSNCNLGAIKIAFNLGSVEAEAEANPFATGCVPLNVHFQNNSSNATEFTWDFGDGTTSSAFEPNHTYTQPGIYVVEMIAHNPNACKQYDTVFLEIVVLDQNIEATLETTLHDLCTEPYAVFNLETVLPDNIDPNEVNYHWDFGDGQTSTAMNPGTHDYLTPGAYDVTLSISHPELCNSPLLLTETIEVFPFEVEALFDFPSPICKGTTVDFLNLSQNAMTYEWECGPYFNSSDVNVSHTFDEVGSFEIRLKVSNPESCNLVDELVQVIEVFDHAIASFDWSPNPPVLNEPIHFINTSLLGDTFLWTFGDGAQSSAQHPEHSYLTTGSYNVCLTASFNEACPHTVCKEIRARVESVADLPSAFSPNGDGENDILYVRGYNVERIHLQIFNRWGQLVFESYDINNGWDGTFQGLEQPMEVYGYVLKVEYKDGSHSDLQGNVTLLR